MGSTFGHTTRRAALAWPNLRAQTSPRRVVSWQAMDTPELLAAAIGAGPSLRLAAPLRQRNNFLAMAAAAGFAGPVAALLRAEASALARDCAWQKDGPTALMLGTRGGHVEVVDLLLRAGADVMAYDCRGWSALRFAANAGHLTVTRMLLDAGATDICGDKGFCTYDGDAEWDAMKGEHWDVAALLRNSRHARELAAKREATQGNKGSD